VLTISIIVHAAMHTEHELQVTA